MERKIPKISLERSEEKMKEDLERYRQKALELGADRAAVLPVDDISVDERVTLKCRVPRCFGYGVCAHCPPHAIPAQEMREILKKYRWAVFFTTDVPSETIIRNKATIKDRVGAYLKLGKIVNEVESAAFYDGHYLAVGFGAGSCKHSLCSLEENCAALAGQKCRHSLRARPSMEAVGMDVYRLIASQGWDVYPIGSDCGPDNVPQGALAGIVIVD